ncbi:MAG: MlaD family protein [Bacteroidales bacterium]|nr:MlaD family protein [Bacteroidales bacterium]
MKMTKEFRIGAFTVLVLAVTFFVINFLRGKDLLGREMTVKAYYENVEGLLPSAPVYIKGYKAGAVTAVEYLPQEGRFEVSCSIQKQFGVPQDSRMVIYGVDIMGGKGIRIDMGTSSSAAADGAELPGSYEPDLISAVAAGITPLMEKVTGAVDTITCLASGVNRVLDGIDPQGISRSIVHLERTLANVEHLSRSVDGKSGEIASLIDNLSSVSVKLSSVMDKVDTAMANVAGVTSELNESDIAGLVESFRMLLDKIQDPDGTVGKLLNEGTVYTSVDTLLSDIDNLVKKIEENPRKYIKISVF